MSLRYFLSGASGIRADVIEDVASYVDYRLFSMHSSCRSNVRIWSALSHRPKCAIKEVMLDSGAFTAFTQGHKLTLEGLTPSLDETIKALDKTRIKNIWIINLDVIPGAYGRISTPQEIQTALDESDINFRKLKKRYGDRVLPVFHQTESMARLKQVVAQNWFIALSFRQDFGEEQRVNAAELAIEYTHSKGAQVHGLATTGYGMLKRVPFDTVDSSSWIMAAAMGKVMYVNEAGDMATIAVSKESPARHEDRGHFRTVPRIEQDFIEARIKEAKLTIEQVESDLSFRILMCAQQLREWLRTHKRPAVITAEKGLFPI